MRIDVLAIPSRFDALSHFSEMLQKAIKRSGIDSTLHSIEQPFNRLLNHLRKNPPDAVVSFNTAFNITAKGLLQKGVSIPQISLFVDWPTYFPQLFQPKVMDDPNFIAGFVDRDCCDFMREVGMERTFFFPHAIEQESVSCNLPLNKRDWDLVYPGSFINPYTDLSFWKNSLSPKLFQFLEATVERSLRSKTVPLVAMLQNGLEKEEPFIAELEDKQIAFSSLASSVMTVTRGLDRINLLNAVDGTIHVFGEARLWLPLLQDKSKFIFHPPIPFKAISTIFQQSKFVLNCMPMFKHGLHERILYAIANGASIITQENGILPSLFKDGEGIYYYDPSNYKGVNDQIKKALSNEPLRLQHAIHARTYIRENHTWDHRVQLLLSILKGMSLNR